MPELDEVARKFALQNALQHDGRAVEGSVIGRVMAEMPELRKDPRGVIPTVKAIVGAVNSMDLGEQRRELEKLAPELLEKRARPREDALPDLPNVEGSVVMRFAPGPSGPLHLGHTRAAFLNDEYVKRYGGRYIIRLEDTNPTAIEPEAYDTIFEDLDWLGIGYTERAIQSDRFDLYLEYARRLLREGRAYVCSCDVEEWRALKLKMTACPHRDRGAEEQLGELEKMLDGTYAEGEASLVVKSDLDHPNPAVRDFVGMRIMDAPHPRTGDRYRVYPLYNFSVTIDDHEMGMTHVLRGKDHLNNTHRQMYLYKHLGWEPPEFTHYGWVSIEDTLLKTSLIKAGIREGTYSGWDDVRLGTIKAMARRGFDPQALRRYWREVGVKAVDIRFSWQTLYNYDKQIIDQRARRYFFVWDPVELRIEGVDRLMGNAPVHPDHPEWGTRETVLAGGEGGIAVLVVRGDAAGLAPGTRLRLKDLCNVEMKSEGVARYMGNDLSILKDGVRIVHWVPIEGCVGTVVHMPDGTSYEGSSEPAIAGFGPGVVQFERFGFVNVEVSGDGCTGWFTHK